MASGKHGKESPVSVFVRVRPLTQSEAQDCSDELAGLQLTSSGVAELTATAYETRGSAIGGFTGVLGQEALNADVFRSCLVSRLQTVLRGGSVSLFCYGYTGSGKTHTVVGYGQEPGLYFLAAERLLEDLRRDLSGSGLFLRATACEMHNDEVYDLLGPTKVACSLRMDEAGQLQVVGPSTSTPLDEAEIGILRDLVPAEMQPKGVHATLVTRALGLRGALVREPEDLQHISSTCVQKRAVGSSTEHAQSSRSHALLRLEVVSAEMLDALDVLETAQAELPARRNAVDNIGIMRWSVLHDGGKRVLCLPGAADDSGFVRSAENTYEIVEGEAKSDFAKLVGHEAEGAKTLSEWAALLGQPSLVYGYRLTRREFDPPGRWEEIDLALTEKQEKLKKLLGNAEANVKRALLTLEEIKTRGPACLGGSLLLVDLAGADYDHRSGQQQKESAAINKSLLALKECFRAIAKPSAGKPKFRDSKLTRLLEDSLAPNASSRRRNTESTSVMLVNVSSAEHLGKMTLNTLRYGQLFAAGAEPKRAPLRAKAPARGLAVSGVDAEARERAVAAEPQDSQLEFSAAEAAN